MDDSKQLIEYGYTHTTAKAELPECIGLVYKIGSTDDKDEFEPLDITPVSTPPDLPEVMKGDNPNPNNIDA
jgi:transcription elongation factor B subunit 2